MPDAGDNQPLRYASSRARPSRILGCPVGSRSSTLTAMPLDMRPRISFDPPGVFPLRLARLHEQERGELRRIAVPMKTDCGYKFRARTSLLLPKLFVAVEARFGRCSPIPHAHETWFCVPLLLSAKRDDGSLHYLVAISDLRGLPGLPNVDYYHLDRSRAPGSAR
jgi:hypothetical protein